MTKRAQLIASAALVIVGSILFATRAERRFITLPPTTGLENAVKLTPDNTYSQSFVVGKSPLSRLGIYIRPLVKEVPADPLTIQLWRNDTLLAEERISAVFASIDASAAIKFSPPVKVAPQETLRMEIITPAQLSGKVALQKRIQDETFNRDAVFTFNGELQKDPLAYEVFYSIYPPITLFFGGLVILAGLLLAIRAFSSSVSLLPIYTFGIVAIANAPLVSRSYFSLWLILLQIPIFLISFRMFREQFSRIPALLGSHTLTFTSWWSLVFITGRTPLPALLGNNIRDILVDPNQIGLSNPGAYTGLIAVLLAISSFLFWSRKQTYAQLQLGGLGSIILGTLIHPLFAMLGIILLAMNGLQKLLMFLGEKVYLVRILLYAVVYLSLLDVLTVYVQILELL